MILEERPSERERPFSDTVSLPGLKEADPLGGLVGPTGAFGSKVVAEVVAEVGRRVGAEVGRRVGAEVGAISPNGGIAAGWGLASSKRPSGSFVPEPVNPPGAAAAAELELDPTPPTMSRGARPNPIPRITPASASERAPARQSS
jgi:hypothetical protein